MERLKFLFTKYKNTECTSEEVEELLDVFAQGDKATPLMDEIAEILDDDFSDSTELSQAVDGVYANLHRNIFHESERKNRAGLKLMVLKRLAVAASIVLVAGFSYLYYIRIRNSSIKEQSPVFTNDINPGQNKATLHLGNGKIIELSTGKKGIVIAGAKFDYDDGVAITSASAGPQTVVIETPRGGQYKAELPDGTYIWLNAGTKLRFPSRFTEVNRTVFLSGEAYFEVHKDKSHPFIVISEGQKVEVLGTHFNINAYKDESSIRTTLLEGAVKLNDKTFLKPNQQAVLTAGGIKVVPVIADSFIDWKEGVFNFDDENLQSIMRKVSRWYNVQVVYAGTEDDEQIFSGSVSRSAKISKILKKLTELSNLKFELRGNTIVVSNINK